MLLLFYIVKDDFMEKNKKVLSLCPNFDKIINADFSHNDGISKRLVKIYKDFIFNSDINDLEFREKIRNIDYIMGLYIDDFLFRKNLQTEITQVKVKKTITDIIVQIVDSIIDIFKKYEMESTRKIYISRWI